MKKIILAVLPVFLVVSCKDSVDEPNVNPITQEILTNGLNISANGADTTVVFPLLGDCKVDVSYLDDEKQWCSANETSEGNESKLNIKCQPSSTSLIQRQARVMLSSANKSYELIIRQAPLAQAYADNTVYYMPSDGGTLTIPIHANTIFRVDKDMYVTGSGNNTRRVDTSWLGVKNEHEKVKADADNIYKLEVNAQLNTGLGRNAFLSIRVAHCMFQRDVPKNTSQQFIGKIIRRYWKNDSAHLIFLTIALYKEAISFTAYGESVETRRLFFCPLILRLSPIIRMKNLQSSE